LLLIGLLLAGCRTPVIPTPLPVPGFSPVATVVSPVSPLPTPLPETFSGEVAYGHVLKQMAFGPRPPGSPALRMTGDYIKTELEGYGWAVEDQEFTYQETPIRNLIARKGEGPVVILGAHYDTRPRADQDKTDPTAPVPGANDGASGVAVLLELARTLDMSRVPYQVWLAFFDAEDSGGLDGWEWIVGSSYMAEHLTVQPDFVIIVDMIGDADQQLYLEQNSTPEVRGRIWAVAAELGYGDYFINRPGYSMLDDHTPFLRRGLRAVDIIDFDYPYWHTTADTADKVSPASLERVGRTLQAFLEQPSPIGQP
jgi:hypothetical protein